MESVDQRVNYIQEQLEQYIPPNESANPEIMCYLIELREIHRDLSMSIKKYFNSLIISD